MATLSVLSVFTDADHRHGNLLGVFVDGTSVPLAERQGVAARLGFSETVFIDDAALGSLAIFTPTSALPFAGHPLVGTSWLLRQQGRPVTTLRPPAGDVLTWEGDGMTWISGQASWAPDLALRQFAAPEEVEALTVPPDDLGFVDCWAWIDEEAGHVRCRVFAADVGIFEDEATGAAAVRLASHLGRPLTIRQGQGSIIEARPGTSGAIEIGGRVRLVETREDSGR